jgi:hypothetical protein
MPLSNKDLSDIAKEFAVAKGDMADDKAAIPNIQAEIIKKDDQTSRIYILYNNAHVERVTPYETEHRWIDGTTYTTITKSQIETFGSDGRATYFFPTPWQKSNPQLTDNGNGNPRTSNGNSESFLLNTSLENQGLVTTINVLRNGISGAGGVALTQNPVHDIPAGVVFGLQLDVTSTTNFNTNDLVFINKGSSSGIYLVTAVSASHLTIDSIIPSSIGFTGIGSTIRNSVVGFTNSERNTLISATYQEILTQLTNRIKTTAALWDTALLNQLNQLNINIDAAAQITAAKTAVTTARTAYSTWFALLDTGATGKFVDTSLNNLATAYNTRNSGFAARISQITTALGSVSQSSEGVYSGSGNYLQRFKCLSFLNNTSNGPLYQVNGLKTAKTQFEDRVKSTADKLATFSNLVRYGAGTKDPVGNTLEIDGVSQFAVSDAVILTANDLASITCTITGISGKIVTLSATIPPEYTKVTKIGIIKQL